MKQSIWTIIKITLIVLILGTLIILFIPSNVEIPDYIVNPITTEPEDTKEENNIIETKLVIQGDIAVMFGWKRPTPSPPPRVTQKPTATPKPTIIISGFLKFTGKYIDSDGIEYFLFIDQRHNKALNLAKGKPYLGWEFIEETEESYLLTKDNEKYRVLK